MSRRVRAEADPKPWVSTSVAIPGGAAISIVVRPAMRVAFEAARCRAGSKSRSDWAEHVILSATDGLYEGNAHERLRAAARDIDLPERTLLRLWMSAATENPLARTMMQARAFQDEREREK